MTMTPSPLTVLVISPDPRVPGGVSNFAETMKLSLTNTRVMPYWIGSLGERKEGRLDTLRRLLVTPFDILRLVRREKIDVVHINPSLDRKAIIRDGLVLLALRLTGFHHVLVYIHGWQAKTANAIDKSPILRSIFVWMLNGVGRVMVLSPEFKTELEKMGVDGNRVILTRTMFDGKSLPPSKNPPPARRSILFMSRFDKAKGVYELMDAFIRIAPEFPDVDLVMAGGGQEDNSLRTKAAAASLSNRILFAGYVSGIAKTKLLQECTIFALPTYYPEGMPVALLEAMGAGKVLLTAKAGGIRYIISEPDNGIVLDVVTTDSVEAALRKLLNDPALCAMTGRHNADYAWGRFEAKVVTAEIEATYNDIAKAGD